MNHKERLKQMWQTSIDQEIRWPNGITKETEALKYALECIDLIERMAAVAKSQGFTADGSYFGQCVKLAEKGGA